MATAISAPRCWWRAVRQNGAELDHGELFTCLAEPLEDCVLHWDGVLAPGELPVRELNCQVTECQAVGGDVFRVCLRAPAGKVPRYHAGQYLLLQRPDGEMAAFSWLRRHTPDVSWSCTSSLAKTAALPCWSICAAPAWLVCRYPTVTPTSPTCPMGRWC